MLCSLFLQSYINYLNFTFRFKQFIVLFCNNCNYVDDIGGFLQVFKQERFCINDLIFCDILFQGENDGLFVGDSWEVDQKELVPRFSMDQ